MFKELIEYFETLNNFNGIVRHNIIELTGHFEKETPRIFEIFKKVNKKYDYKDYEKLVDIPTFDTHLEFWRGSGEFDLALLQASLNGVYDPDPEFGRFYDQFESCDWTRFQEYENDDQRNSFYELQYNLFYTWLSFIWQDLNDEMGGFPVKVLENNAASVFNLIDFAWYDNSKYHIFLDTPKRRLPYFKRTLKMTELYSRVKIKYNYEVFCERILQKGDRKIEIAINEFNIQQTEINKGHTELIYKIDKKGYGNIPIFVNKHSELLNDNWEDITFTKQNSR